VRFLLAAAAALTLAACSGSQPGSQPIAAVSPNHADAAPAAQPAAPVPTPSEAPTEPPTPAPTPAPVPPAPVQPAAPPAPAYRTVGFGGLPAGIYPTHLHTICDGGQNFHLAYLQSLTIGPSHSGAISVPAADFGRNWCVIVYTDASASRVLAVQHI